VDVPKLAPLAAKRPMPREPSGEGLGASTTDARLARLRDALAAPWRDVQRRAPAPRPPARGTL
jgi:hypothetical protein